MNPSNFGPNLKAKLKISQRELADRSGLTESAVSQILSGVREPSLSSICKILSVTKIKFETLVKLILLASLISCAPKKESDPIPEKPLASVWKSADKTIDLSGWKPELGSTSEETPDHCHFVRTITDNIIYEFNFSCGISNRFYWFSKYPQSMRICTMTECESFL